MPCYTYLCNSCQKKFEIICSYSDYDQHHPCEFCKSKKTERSYYDDLSTLNSSIKLSDNEIKTLGHLAARNSEKFSEDYKNHLHNKHNSYKESQSTKELPSGMSRISKPKGKMKWN